MLELRADSQRIVILSKVIRSRRWDFTGDVAPVGDTRGGGGVLGFGGGDLREREYLEDLGVGGRLLKWTLGAGFWRLGLD